MKLKVIAKSLDCKILICPTIYKTEKGSFVVQGKCLSNKIKSELSLPEHEDAVEVPADLIEDLVKNFKK